MGAGNYIEIPLADAIEATGLHKAVAAVCGVSLRTVYYWTQREKPIPNRYHDRIRTCIDQHGGTPDAALRETADIVQALLEAWADGRISPAEATMIEREGLEATIELTRARRLARSAAKGGAV